MIGQNNGITIKGQLITDYKQLCVLAFCKELLTSAQQLEDYSDHNVNCSNVLKRAKDGNEISTMMDDFTKCVTTSKFSIELLFAIAERVPIVRAYYNTIHNRYKSLIANINSLTPLYLCFKLLEPYVEKGLIVFDDFDIKKMRSEYTWKSTLSKERRNEMDNIATIMIHAINTVKLSSLKTNTSVRKKKRKK